MDDACVVITTAVTAEAMPLVNRLKLRRDATVLDDAIVFTGAWKSGLESCRLVLMVTGIGAGRAERLMRQCLDRCRPRAVILSGFAGAASPTLRLGDVIIPAVVEDGAARNAVKPAIFADNLGCLRTMKDMVSTPAEKAILFADGADAVDMETAAMAAACAERGTPWLAVRAISDEAHEQLPRWLVGLTQRDGRPDLLAAVLLALTRPREIRRLLRLGKTSKLAAGRMAEAIEKILPRCMKI